MAEIQGDDEVASQRPATRLARALAPSVHRSARQAQDRRWGAGGHYIAVIPARRLVVVHRVDTDDPSKKVALDQFGTLLQLILAAKGS